MTQQQTYRCHRFAAIARAEIGIHEIPGPAAAARIVQYLRSCPHLPASMAQEDETPWCAAFVGWVIERTGCNPTGSAMARSYLAWGVATSEPIRGAVAVLKRGKAPNGHVGFWVGNELGDILLLGGNQSDSVSIARFPKSQVLSYRIPSL